MKANQIVYSAVVGGYTYVYDVNGFISVFDKLLADVTAEGSTIQCIYTSLVKCQNKKEFELEIIYVSQKIYEM